MKITMEGAVVENALDVVVLAPGKAVAFDRTYPVTVTDGILNIGFARATGATSGSGHLSHRGEELSATYVRT